jgi:hypothetical protein
MDLYARQRFSFMQIVDEATGLLGAVTYTPALIESFRKGTAEQKAIFSRFNQLASILDQYNNGNMGTPHAP